MAFFFILTHFLFFLEQYHAIIERLISQVDLASNLLTLQRRYSPEEVRASLRENHDLEALKGFLHATTPTNLGRIRLFSMDSGFLTFDLSNNDTNQTLGFCG